MGEWRARSLRTKVTPLRVVGAGAVVAMIGVFLVAQPEVNAAISTYTCQGVTDDVGATTGYIDWFSGYYQPTASYSSASVIDTLHQYGQITLPLNITVTATGSVPATASPGQQFPTSFNYQATLPPPLVASARGIGFQQITVTNAQFGINVEGATPAVLPGSFASNTYALPASNLVQITQPVSGNVTAGNGSLIVYRPGTIRLSVVLNVVYYLPIGELHVGVITISCTPDGAIIQNTTITSGGGGGPTTTVVPTTVVPTTVVPTTVVPTTVVPTTVVPTTVVAPTSTVVVPTTVVAPTSTASPPTTGVPPTSPPATPHSGSVSVGGSLGYSNSGTFSGNYQVGSDDQGVTSMGGTGTIPGINGGAATVSVNIYRSLWWLFGEVSVSDPGASFNATGYVLFAPVPPTGTNTVSAMAYGFSWENFTLSTYQIALNINA